MQKLLDCVGGIKGFPAARVILELQKACCLPRVRIMQCCNVIFSKTIIRIRVNYSQDSCITVIVADPWPRPFFTNLDLIRLILVCPLLDVSPSDSILNMALTTFGKAVVRTTK